MRRYLLLITNIQMHIRKLFLFKFISFSKVYLCAEKGGKA